MFYPDIKPHISPSAFAAFHKNHTMFVRNYFKGEKMRSSSAMKAGKKIHALIEGGLLVPKNRFDKHEQPIRVSLLEPANVDVFGIPDSYETEPRLNTTWEGGRVAFVDYKSGKANAWTSEKIAVDLKMLLTAWLVAKKNPKASNVEAIIEYIPTQWNEETKEIELTGGEHEVCSHVFTADMLSRVSEMLIKTISKVNEEYENFEEGADSVVDDEDCRFYSEINEKIKALETKQEAVKTRIKDQLSMGGTRPYESPFGTFYFTERKKYKHPDDLEAQTESGNVITLAFAEEVAKAMSTVKKQWELTNEPVSITRTMSFRAKK